MTVKRVDVDPENEIGISVGQLFIGFDKFHDFDASPLTGKTRFIVNLDQTTTLWLIEALAKELPEVLQDEAIDMIARLESNEQRRHERCK